MSVWLYVNVNQRQEALTPLRHRSPWFDRSNHPSNHRTRLVISGLRQLPALFVIVNFSIYRVVSENLSLPWRENTRTRIGSISGRMEITHRLKILYYSDPESPSATKRRRRQRRRRRARVSIPRRKWLFSVSWARSPLNFTAGRESRPDISD